MRILVTGVAGQVGGALVARLQGFGTVLAADRSILDLSKPDTVGRHSGSSGPDDHCQSGRLHGRGQGPG